MRFVLLNPRKYGFVLQPVIDHSDVIVVPGVDCAPQGTCRGLGTVNAVLVIVVKLSASFMGTIALDTQFR